MSSSLPFFIWGLPQATSWQGNRSMLGFFSVFLLSTCPSSWLDSYFLTPPKLRMVRGKSGKGIGMVLLGLVHLKLVSYSLVWWPHKAYSF